MLPLNHCPTRTFNATGARRIAGVCAAPQAFRSGQRHLQLAMVVATVMLILTTQPAMGQQDNPVYVGDSPQARELLRQARDQQRENAGEAVRLYQELLSDYGQRLAPAGETATDLFTSTRARVMAALRNSGPLLDRYRLVHTPAAEQLLQQGDRASLVEAAGAYALTEPGLEAMLRLAQHDLESGRFHAAIYWLNEVLGSSDGNTGAHMHPDLAGRRAVHARYMAALTARYMGANDRAQAERAALARLEGADAEAFVRELERLLAADAHAALTTAVTSLDHAPQPALEDIVAQPIWTVVLEDSIARRRARAANPQDFERMQMVPRDVIIDNRNNLQPGNRANQGIGLSNAPARSRDAELAAASATVLGNVAYVNQGHTILALDRLTGRELWSYQDLSRLGMTEASGTLDALDMTVVTVAPESDTLLTLTGHAQPNRRSDSGRLLCLNASDGSLRWSTRLAGMLDSAPDEDLFPHGSPVIMEHLAFVLARKVTSQLLTSVYLIALHVEDGSVAWTRFIASSGGLRIAARPFDSLLLNDQGVFLSSAVGAAACIVPQTGEIRWLRRFNVPINTPIADQNRRPWEMPAPVMTPAGLVTLSPDGRRIHMLDAETGDELASHPASSTGDWNSPRYLLADDMHVYGVGEDIRAFAFDVLDAPLWRVPALALQQSPDDRTPMAADTMQIRGRVHLAGDKMIAPSDRGLLIIDAITGSIDQTLPIDAGGNPLASDAQLLLASADRLDAFMSLERAEHLLRGQMAASPAAPEPALSLMRLGVRAGNIPLALEAADHAMAATRAFEDDPAFDQRRFSGRAELFALLLDMARTRTDLTIEQGEGVFMRLQQAAVGPEQRVQHLLSYGDWLTRHSLPRAMETWQTVLSDQRLATVWIIDNAGSGAVARTAASRASERIGRIIATRGAAAYAPQADFAALRLAQLGAAVAEAADVEQLMRLAREFPHAPAAVEAAVRASDVLAARGAVRAAMAALTQTYLAAPSRASATRLMGRYADLAIAAGWHDTARGALLAVRDAWGDLALESIGSTTRASERIAQLQTGDRAGALPRIGTLSGEAITLAGTLVGPASVGNPTGGSASAAVGGSPSLNLRLPADRALLRSGSTIHLVRSDRMEPAWSVDLDEGSVGAVGMLHADDQSVVLFSGSDPEHPRAWRIDATDGTLLWSTPQLSQAIVDPAPWGSRGGGVGSERTRGSSREQMPNGETYDPQQTLALWHADSLVLVHRSGQVASISGSDGRSVRWSGRSGLQQVHLASVSNGLLILTGMAIDEGAVGGRPRMDADAQQSPGALTPRIVVIDPDTGRPAFGVDGSLQPLGRAGVKWFVVSPLGVMVCASLEGLEAINAATGERLWSTTSSATIDSLRGWAMSDRVVFEGTRSRLRFVRIEDGMVSEPFEPPLRGEWDPMEFRELLVSGRMLVARFAGRIVMFDGETGRVAGADAIAEDRDFRWILETEDGLQAVSFSSMQMPTNVGGGVGGGSSRRTQYQYTAYALSRNGKALGSLVRTDRLPERVQQVHVIDGWLLLSTLTDTLAVPMQGR